MEYKMQIVSTSFDHKEIHKTTWISPDGRTHNQIDHILLESKHLKSVKDVRSFRGADAKTDHFLMIMRFEQEMPEIPKERLKTKRKYNIEYLKDIKKKEEFEKDLTSRLAEKIVDNIESEWERIETVILQINIR